MAKLKRKPWNDPWTSRAEVDDQYKAYCYGHKLAARFSWRRLKKLHLKSETVNPKQRAVRMGRREFRLFLESQAFAGERA